MNDPYKPLHARPLVPVEAPHLISVVAFRVDYDRFGSTDDASTRNETSVPTATIENFIKELYAAHGATPPEPDPGETLYDAFALQQMIEIKGRRCVMQKHTNFFPSLSSQRIQENAILLSAGIHFRVADYGFYVIDKVFFDREPSWIISISIVIAFICVFLFTRRGKSLSERLSRALDLSEPRAK